MTKKPLKKRIKNDVIYLVIRFFIRFIQIISRRSAFLLLQGIGWIAFYLAVGERNKTIRHLTMVYGTQKSPRQIRQMAHKVFINLGRNAVDALRLPLLLKSGLRSLVTARGLEHLDRALALGRGVLAITGHIGNWELMAAWLANQGYPIWAVGAKVYDSRLNKIIAEQRKGAGYHNIERGKATRQMFRALKQNGVVGLLIDQDTRVAGVFVDFLGKLAFTPVGPVLLALKTGTVLLPMAIHIRKNNKHLLTIKPAIELIRTGDEEQDRLLNTTRCSKEIEAFIRDHPTQWVWMHERWKTIPEQ